MTTIHLPPAGIILLVGPSNTGKTTLLNQFIQEEQIQPSEVVSSDQFRVLVSDIEFISWNGRPKEESEALFHEYQQISGAAFEAMDYVISKRCKLNKLTFIDATHLREEEHEKYLQMGKEYHVPVIALVLNISETELMRRDMERAFPRGRNRIKQQYQHFKNTLRFIKKKPYRRVYMLGEDELQIVNVSRLENPLYIDIGTGIDFIGDIHGCLDEFLEMLNKLGYKENDEGYFIHPKGRKILSLGDVLSRGPRSIETLQFFQKHVAAGLTYMIDSK
jgi:predicted kinase